MKFFFFILAISSSALAQELPGPPPSPDHPGSKIYSYTVERRDVRCDGRDVAVFYPREIAAKELPLLVYGHGQALGVEHYEQTLRHLAGKGAIAVHPQYDKGFFDQDIRIDNLDFLYISFDSQHKLRSESEVIMQD